MTQKTIDLDILQAILWDALHPGIARNQLGLHDAFNERAQRNAENLAQGLADRGYKIVKDEEPPILETVAAGTRAAYGGLSNYSVKWSELDLDTKRRWTQVVTYVADQFAERFDVVFSTDSGIGLHEAIEQVAREFGAKRVGR